MFGMLVLVSSFHSGVLGTRPTPLWLDLCIPLSFLAPGCLPEERSNARWCLGKTRQVGNIGCRPRKGGCSLMKGTGSPLLYI